MFGSHAILRKRIVSHLNFVDFVLDGKLNEDCTSPQKLTIISQQAQSKPIIVIPADENLQMVREIKRFLKP